jgi:hypothetical protein
VVEWDKSQKVAAAVLAEVLVWGLILGSGYWLGFPTGGLVPAGLFLVNLLAVVGVYYTSRTDAFSGYQTTTEEQLTVNEANELAQYLLAYGKNYGYRVDRKIDFGIDPAQAPSDDKEDAVRLYKLEFEPLNVQGKATLYIDLEQDLSVDVDDPDSLENAMKKLQNTRMQKSWLSVDYEERVEDTKESLGRSVEATVTKIIEKDEGREVVERPQITQQNQSNSNQSSPETES